MITPEQTTNLRQLIDSTKSIVIAIGADATLDQYACATALSASLETSGREVLLVSPTEPRVEHTSLFSIDKVKTELGNRNLSVSFDYTATSVDKVSYHIGEETNKFYLTIKPQKGHQPLDTKTVEFAYTGADADFIFLIGVHSLESLEQLYYGHEQFFTDTTIVTFHNFEPNIGQFKLSTAGAASMSEVMTKLMVDLGLEISGDVATNLLVGIEAATDNFSSLTTTAETFEAVSQLMRLGARRIKSQAKVSHKESEKFAQVFAQKQKQDVEVKKEVSEPAQPAQATQSVPVVPSPRQQTKPIAHDSLTKRKVIKDNRLVEEGPDEVEGEVVSPKEAEESSSAYLKSLQQTQGGLDHKPGKGTRGG